jgi:hypothetical protein
LQKPEKNWIVQRSLHFNKTHPTTTPNTHTPGCTSRAGSYIVLLQCTQRRAVHCRRIKKGGPCDGRWPRWRWEAALPGARQGRCGGDPAGLHEDGAKPQQDPRWPLWGRDQRHTLWLRRGPWCRLGDADLPRYVLEPSLFSLRVPIVGTDFGAMSLVSRRYYVRVWFSVPDCKLC